MERICKPPAGGVYGGFKNETRKIRWSKKWEKTRCYRVKKEKPARGVYPRLTFYRRS
jgi:hypothetical protein